MSEHPHVTVINRMTKAVFENDRDTLSELFTDDMIFQFGDRFLGLVTTRALPASSELWAPSSS